MLSIKRQRAWVALILALVSPAVFGQVWERPVAPGVTYRLEVRQDPPLMIHALRVAPAASARFESHLATVKVYDRTPFLGRSTVREMAAATDAQIGINGDFFQWTPDPGGAPNGFMVRNGELISRPVTGDGWRSWGFGWGREARAIAQGTWESEILINAEAVGELNGLNRRVEADEWVLFTQVAGMAYGSEAPWYALIQPRYQNLSPAGELRGEVFEVFTSEERVRVPDGMALLAGRGANAETLQALNPGAEIQVSWAAGGFDWDEVENVMGGGPYLVREGEIIQEPDEPQHPRTAIGWDSEGAIWWVVIDGRQEVSVGTTLFETAEIMRDLGCVEALNLDGGGSSTLHVAGATLNRPSAGAERTVANGILGFLPVSEAVSGELELRLVAGGAGPVASSVAILESGEEVRAISGSGWRGEVWLDGEPVPADQIAWAAQGGAWVDGDGQLTAIGSGEVVLSALYRGRLVQILFMISP